MTEPLTERQVEIVRLVATGLTNNQIADELIISERTVRTHVSDILLKLSLENRTQLTIYALRAGIVTLSDIEVDREYEHRNGEIEPPAESGIYWTENEFVDHHDLTQIAIMITGKYQWRSLLLDSSWETFLPSRAKQMGIRWYGPVISPWDKQTRGEARGCQENQDAWCVTYGAGRSNTSGSYEEAT